MTGFDDDDAIRNTSAEHESEATALDESAATEQPTWQTSDGLRALLVRLHQAGPDAWREDPEAEDLMHYVTSRYAALARSHDLTPEDAAHAAYLAMRASSTRTAHDPWAVVTTAVRVSLIAEARAHALLISPDRARRKVAREWRDVQRFADRADGDDFGDYHPAIADHAAPEDDRREAAWQAQRVVQGAVEGVITLLVVRGWPPGHARVAVDYVCEYLIQAGERHKAYELLRRDRTARAMLDLDQRHWMDLLHIMLGRPSSAHLQERHGAMARLAAGDALTDILDITDGHDPGHRRGTLP